MDCSCGDPSCGYCQAAFASEHYYPFGEVPQVHHYELTNSNLETIHEENEEMIGDQGTGYQTICQQDVYGEEEDQEDLEELENLEEQEKQPELPKSHDLNSLQISEDEKKRLRNTEAARRCREKIKKRTDELEEELMAHMTKNDSMNQQRIRLLSQIGEQMRMLELLKKRNPSAGRMISEEANMIVDKYRNEVKIKRKAIAEFYNNIRSF